MLANGTTHPAQNDITWGGGNVWARKGDPLTIVNAVSFNGGRDYGYTVTRADGEKLTLQMPYDIEPSPYAPT